MTGSMIVNNLAGLMMLTSLFVISVKSYRLSCGFYACQSLVLALLAWRAPELVEIGIATDAIFAVIVMVLLARKIWRTHGTLDVNNLTALKG
ncbi:TPA: hypothetical protein KTV73_000371 [Escherichia coli]|nr:hypothetical protein [Escherichia coli]